MRRAVTQLHGNSQITQYDHTQSSNKDAKLPENFRDAGDHSARDVTRHSSFRNCRQPHASSPLKVVTAILLLSFLWVMISALRFATNLEPSLEDKVPNQALNNVDIRSNYAINESNPKNQPQREWAYVFLLGAIDPNRPEQYIGMLYNIIIATYNLRHTPPSSQEGNINTYKQSIADVIVMVQFSIHTTVPRVLPTEQVQLLESMNILIQYLPTPTEGVQNFYTVTLEKFRVLTLTKYSRVMFLDSDVMPFCSLDYLFDLSEPIPSALSTRSGRKDYNNGDATRDNKSASETTVHNSTLQRLEENVLLAWRNSPAHAGIFILRPNVEDWDMIQSIVKRREREAVSLPWPHFNSTHGWGHVIDTTTANVGDANNDGVRILYHRHRGGKQKQHETHFSDGRIYHPWDWYCSQSDQGLLYYWTKYVKQKVSIIIGEEVEAWIPSDNRKTGFADSVITSSTKNGPRLRAQYANHPLSSYACLPKGMQKRGSYGYTEAGFSRNSVPYIDIAHFTSQSKPWEQPYAAHLMSSIRERIKAKEITPGGEIQIPQVSTMIQNATEYWFYILGVTLKNMICYKDNSLIQNMDTILQKTQGQNPPVGHAIGIRQMIMAARARQTTKPH